MDQTEPANKAKSILPSLRIRSLRGDFEYSTKPRNQRTYNTRKQRKGTCESLQSLNTPKRLRHDKIATPCLKCDQVFSSDSHMRRHLLNIHHFSDFLCTTCGENFSCKKNLALHMHSAKHGTLRDFRAMVCLKCKSVFTQIRLLKNHISNIHKGTPTKYQHLWGARTFILNPKKKLPRKNSDEESSMGDLESISGFSCSEFEEEKCESVSCESSYEFNTIQASPVVKKLQIPSPSKYSSQSTDCEMQNAETSPSFSLKIKIQLSGNKK